VTPLYVHLCTVASALAGFIALTLASAMAMIGN
jgi:hypothetical protein